jgi:siroheme synthase-like protein
MGFIPVMLRAANISCLIVGGGAVAARKAILFLEAGARVTVIARSAGAQLMARRAATGLRIEERDYEPGDIRGFRMVIAATDDPCLNDEICREAGRAGILHSSVTSADRSEFMTAANVRRGDFVLAVSTLGAAPYFTKRLRDQLDLRIDPNLGERIVELAILRERALREHPQTSSPSERRKAVDAALESRVTAIIQRIIAR